MCRVVVYAPKELKSDPKRKREEPVAGEAKELRRLVASNEEKLGSRRVSVLFLFHIRKAPEWVQVEFLKRGPGSRENQRNDEARASSVEKVHWCV